MIYIKDQTEEVTYIYDTYGGSWTLPSSLGFGKNL